MVTIPLDRSMNNVSIRCEAENGALDHPLVATKVIYVLYPPKRVIVRHPEHDPQMIVGQTARLTCNVPSSNPAAEISWEFDSGNSNKPVVEKGQYLYNRTSSEYGGWEVENFVTFTPTEKMHGSSVRCIASHPLWNDVKSNSYILNVFYPPRVVVDGPISIVVGEGESFRENISVVANPPVASYRWRKNGIYFENTIGSVYTRGSLIGGKAVTPSDTGIYTLVANNIYGSVNISMKITVEYPARVTFITSPVIASVGEEVVLECEADGVPKKKGMVKWMRGTSELKNLVPGEEKRAVLRLNATHENSGPYVCVADNGVGRPNYTTAYLLVKKPPQIIRSRGSDRAAGPLGGRARLRCRASAVPGVNFQWSLEGQPAYIQHNSSKYLFHDRQLDHSTFESTLWIIGLDERDYSRRVRCGVSNNLGNDNIYIGIGPPTNPDVPTELEVVNVTDKTALLSWVTGFDGGSDQTFEIRYQMRGSLKNAKSINVSESQAILTGLEPEKIYYVQIRAVNEQGRTSEFSLPAIEIHTLNLNGVDVQKALVNEESFSRTTLIAFFAGLVILLLINCILLCYLHRRQRRKKIQEKTEIVRTLNPSSDGAVRPVQMYGAIGGGTPAISRRPDSMNTNKSELVDPADIDSQSQRTVIEVSPNGYMQRYDPNYYDPNVIVEYDTDPIYYSKINKNNGGLSNNMSNITYSAVPHPEPPENSRLIDNNRYGEILVNSNGTLTRNNGGSLNGSRHVLMDSPRRYRTGLLGTLPNYSSNQGAYGQYPTSPQDLPPLPTDSSNNNNYGVYMSHQRSPPPPAQMFSTFAHPGGVRTTSTSNMPLPDGDLV
uniref:Nephrin n=1 Tax=Acrobeloides nanus TaxID=290746 RepID=A0A914CKH7_9BILA